MSERTQEQEKIDGGTVLFHLQRLWQINRDMEAQEHAISVASTPIKQAVGNMAAARTLFGKDFNFDDLSPDVREAVSTRARMHTELDYIDAERQVIYQDVKEKLFATLNPGGIQNAELRVKDLGGHRETIRPSLDPGGERPQETTGTFAGLGPRGRFYMVAGRELYEIVPFSPEATESQVEIVVNYPEQNT